LCGAENGAPRRPATRRQTIENIVGGEKIRIGWASGTRRVRERRLIFLFAATVVANSITSITIANRRYNGFARLIYGRFRRHAKASALVGIPTKRIFAVIIITLTETCRTIRPTVNTRAVTNTLSYWRCSRNEARISTVVDFSYDFTNDKKKRPKVAPFYTHDRNGFYPLTEGLFYT